MKLTPRILAVLISLLWGASSVQALSIPISIHQVLDKALVNHAQLRTASLDVKIAQTALDRYRGGYDPVVSLASAYTHSDGVVQNLAKVSFPNENGWTLSTGVNHSSDSTTMLSQAFIRGDYILWGQDGVANSLQREALEASLKSKQAQYQFLVSTVLTQVADAYWAWVFEYQQQGLTYQLQEDYALLGQRMQRLVQLQERPSADLTPIFAEIELHTADVAQQRGDLQSAKTTVLSLIGEPLNGDECWPSTAFPSPQSIQAISADQILAGRSDYIAEKYQLDFAKKSVAVSLKKGDPLTKIFAQWGEDVPGLTPENSPYTVGVSLDFTLWNHGQKSTDDLAKAVLVAQTEALAQTKTAILNEAETALKLVAYSQQELEKVQSARRYLEKNIQDEEKKLANGIGSMTDVLQQRQRLEFVLNRELAIAANWAKNLLHYGYRSGQLVDPKTHRVRSEWIP